MAVQSPKKSSALPWPALVPLGHHAGKSAISLKKTVILVGSRHNAHLHLLSRHVSKAHALILSDGGRSYIRDLASREQIYVNGVAEREAWLKEGDLLKIGSFTFKFKEGPGAADAQEFEPESAVLAIEGNESPLAIAEKVMLIGRRATCDVSLIEASVSTAHAVMFHVGGKRFLRDLGSRTGTWVNGAKIHQVELNAGDSIKIGETEMRYDLASAYETALAPVEEEKNDLDELEDLVGTARIDMVSEMKKAEPLSPDLEADLRSMFGAGADAKPAKDDDLIELEIAHEPKPVPAAKTPPQSAAKEAPRPQPKAPPVEEPIELEPEADLPLEVAETEKPQADWDEIDLSTDPDVTEIPSAADTRAIGMEFDHEPAKPTLSPKIVDGSIDTAEPAEQVLLGHDLHGIADIPASETVEEPLEATWPADVLQTEESDGQTATDDIGARGWQKRARDEQLSVVDEAPLELEESADEQSAQERAAAERAAEEKAEAERAAAEKAAQERAAAEKAAQERAAAEKAAQERATAQRAAEEKAERERAAAEKAAQERAAAEKAAQERAAAEKAAQERAAAEKAAAEKAAQERAAAEKAAAEKAAAEERAAQERAVAERAAQEHAAAEKAAEERAVAEKAAAEEKAAQERAAAEKVEQERAAAEAAAEAKAEQERIAGEEKAAEDRAAAEQVAAEEKAAQERAAAERAAEEKAERERLTEEKAAQKRAAAAEAKAARERAAAERKAAQERAAAERAAAKAAATPKKRGRKSKKEKEAELKAAAEAAAAAAMETEADVIMTPAEPLAEIPAESIAEISAAPVEEIAAPSETTAPEHFAAEAVATSEEEVAPVSPSDAEVVSTEIADLPTEAVTSQAAEMPVEVEALPEELDISPAAIPAEPEAEITPALEAEAVASEIEELPPELDISPASMPQEEPEVETAPVAAIEETPTEVENLRPELDISPASMMESEPAESDSAGVGVEADSASEISEEDLPEIEEFTEEQPELQLVTDSDPLDETSTENLEGLDEVLVLDEDPAPLPAPAGSSHSAPAGKSGSTVAPAEFAPAASEDDFFSAFDDTMPVLELDAAELAPSASHRDPDVLLALDQVDADALEEIEVIESTEPTLDSALDLEAVADQEVVSPQTGEISLTDSVFGKQIEDFSHDSTGEIVEEELEELPEIEEFHDADEELADALNSVDEPEAAAPIAATEEPLEEAHTAQPEETNHNITAGGIDVLAPENLTDESLNTQHFGATGDAVHLDTPGDSQADAILNGQTFEADATGQSVATPTEELQSQSFTSEGDTHVAPPRPDLAGGPPETTTHTRPVGPSSSASYPAPPPPPRMAGLAGGFVMGADLSSFIGGMPLVLPDLAPPPTGFGRAQVSFAGAKAPWEQAQRPSFPVGQSLAQEMMDAAEGLRDAEAMDDDLPQEEVEEESIIDDGAPGDEWNVAGIMEDDYEAPVESFTPAALTAQFQAPAPAAETSVTETPEEEELTLDDLSLEESPQEEVIEELPAAETTEEPTAELSEEDLLSELEELPAEEAVEELSTAETLEELPQAEALEEELAEADLSTEELTAEDAPAEIQPEATDLTEEDLQGLEEIPADDIAETAETEESLADLPELESIDELEATEPHETPAEIQSLESDPLETEWAEQQPEPTDAQAIEADLPVLPEAESSSTFSEDEFLLELDAAPPATLPDEPPTLSTTTNENEVEDLSTEKLTFDEASIEPLLAPPRIGAIEEAVADLQIEQVPEAESLVDRSPPPPVAPAKAKGQQPSKMVMPPPPARTLRPRRGAAASAAEPTPADPVFGSLEHGTTNAPPFGGIGQVREVDVFSQAASLDDNGRAMGAADASVFGGQMRSDPSNGNGDSHAPAVARRPQRVIVPPRMGVLGAGAAVADAETEAGEPLTRPAYRVVPRRSNGKRVLLVIFIMAICMAAAYFAIIYFIHPRQTSTGELHFDGTTSLTKRDRDQLRKEQFAKLTSPQVLLNARTSLMTHAIPIEPGFLKDPAAVAQNLKPQWPDDRPTTMTVEYLGSDPNDKSRVHALLSAMYLENAAVVDQSRHVASDIQKLEKDLADIADQRKRYADRKAIVDAAPTEEAVQKLKDKVAEADSAYGKAVAALSDTKLEVQRAEEKLTPASANKPVVPGDPKSAASDAELAALQKSLTDSAAQITSLKAAASQDADAKRKALDDAIELFQQSAAGLMKDNPQLAQYVQAVQQLQESTHRLGGNLIQVQEQHHALLSKLKTRLDEQMQARRTEIWATDKELIGLRAQLDLAERGYNAARDINLPADSKEIKDALADIKNLKDRIEARKMTLGNDPIFTAVANDIQEMIKVNQASLAADREHIEKDIKDQEQAFAQRNIVEKLPDTQRTQAAALKASQEHVSELRKQYAAALEARTAESNAAIRDLETKVSDLNAKVDERKRVLASNAGKTLTPAEEARLRVIVEQKQVAMKTAGEEADNTLKLLVERTKALKLATDNRTELASAREEVETLKQGLAGADDRERQDKLSLSRKQDEQKSLVTIQKPTDQDVKVTQAGDDSWRYIAYSEAGLAVLFVGILAMVSLSAHKHPAYEHVDEEEDQLPEAETGPLAIQEIGKRQPRSNAKSAVG